MSADESRAQDKGVAIHIMGREFRVSCPEGEEKQLAATVDFVNKRMKELRDTGKVSGNERIAIMAALNLAHELLAQKPAKAGAGVDAQDFRRRIDAMQEKLDTALAADQDKLF